MEDIMGSFQMATIAYNRVNDEIDQERFFDAGKEMGETLVQLGGGKVQSYEGEQIHDGLEVIGGIIYGLTGKEGWGQLEVCEYDVQETVRDFYKAWNMIKTKTFVGLFNGADLALSTLMTVPRDAADCFASKSDLKAFEEWAAQITPVSAFA